MEIANASLDEGTAAAEAMALLFDVRSRDQKKNNVNKFFVSEEILPQTLSISNSFYPVGIGWLLETTKHLIFSIFRTILQYPGKYGQVNDYAGFIAKAKANEIKVAVAADIFHWLRDLSEKWELT